MNIMGMQSQIVPGVQAAQQQQPGTPQQIQVQQAQQQQMPQQSQEHKLENISKVKFLMSPLRDSLAATLKTAAQTLHQNNNVDGGSQKGDILVPRFDRSIEEFYSICDQMELNLKTAIECLTQGASSQRYFPLPVAVTRTEPSPNQESLTYSQFLATVRSQVSYAKEVHDTLAAAAQNVSTAE